MKKFDLLSIPGTIHSRISLSIKKLFRPAIFALLILIPVNAYSGYYQTPYATKNAREKSITIDFQQYWYYTSLSQTWEIDQVFFNSGSYYDTPEAVPAGDRVYHWGCGGGTFNGYDIGEILSYTGSENATWKRIKWRNVPASLKGKPLYGIVDNDANADNDCYDWNNSYYITDLEIPDYFHLNTSVDYTSSTDYPDYVKINYTITNDGGGNEDVTYNIVLYNGSNVEVDRKTATSATTGYFYVPVSNSSADQTYTIKGSTSLNAEGRTINHNFERAVTISRSVAPLMGAPVVMPCDGAIRINFDASSYGTILERCENSSFTGATLISINAGAASSFIDNQELTAGKTYYYRARRWGKVYSSTATVKADFTPSKPPVAALTTVALGIKLDWSYSCANVTKFIIMRKEKGQGGEISLAEIPSSQQTYSDLDASSCKMYAYRIIAVNDQNVQNSSDLSDYAYYSLDITNALSNIKVAKGYSPSKTSISWTCTGLLDEFVILRKIYGSAEQPTQIMSVDAKTSTSTGAARDYAIEDLTGDPGVVYEYTVRGMLSCAGANTQSNDITGIGFRSPTGNVYGRITYSGGQAVQNVDVIASSEDVESKNASFNFNGIDAYLKATDSKNSFADTAFTVQAWIRPGTTDLKNMTVFHKPGKYELGFDASGYLFFADAATRVTFSYGGFTTTDFTHITGVRAAGQLLIYANDSLLKSIDVAPNLVVNNTDSIFIGKNSSGNYFKGYIDEVRVWNRALSKSEISRDYTRLMAGNERSLAAYWRFDEPVTKEFYDISYKNSIYNEHHGKVYKAVRSSSIIPTPEQLMLKGVTDDQGNYLISGIPYLGDGTIYTFRPRFGIHTFDPVSVNRIISGSNSSYVLDFTDNSSFPVHVDVKFKNSTYPVKGVGFKIDGVPVVLGDGTPALTDDIGEVILDVPIGQHKVQAYLANHVFVGDGFITTPEGADRNYQSEGRASLEDATKVHIIGRLAGGAVQQEIPLGFSQSKNNLGDNGAIKIELSGIKYNITNTPGTEDIITHYVPKTAPFGYVAKTSKVAYGDRYVTVYPNRETGEFSLDLIPVSFNVTSATVDGYGNVISSNIPLDLTNVFNKQTSIMETKDRNTGSVVSDTVLFNAALNIIHRENPSVGVTQVKRSGGKLAYFGNTKIVSPNFLGVNDTIAVYNEGTSSYLFNNRPVFVQGEKYYMQISVFESYKYNKSDSEAEDRVPSQDGTVEINNLMNISGATSSIPIDSVGNAIYSFTAGDPNITNGIRTIDIAAKVNGGTYLWINGNPFISDALNPGAFLLGKKSTGTNFVTSGPDEVLMVIRDPHGSGSSAYVEQGSVITKSSNTSVSSESKLSSEVTVSMGAKVITWVGVGAGTIAEVETTNDGSLSLNTTFGGVYSGQTDETITLNTNFSTSGDPAFVGHDGDVFVGNSTNFTYGLCDNVAFVKKKNVSASDTKLWGYETAGDDDYVLVSQKSIAGQKSFGTLFVYPLSYIENTLIPNLKMLRNNILGKGIGLSSAEAQAKANLTHNQVYVSKLIPGQPGYGEENTSSFWGTQASDNNHYSNGPSYTIYFPSGCTTQTDTIMTLNESVRSWEQQLADNEKAKIESLLEKNYSFSSGSSVTLSKQTGKTETKSGQFSVVLGSGVGWVLGGDVLGVGMKLDLKTESSITTGSGTTESNANTFTSGFSLSEGNGYLSEDVCTAKDGSYVFKLKGGATSCPYEGGYTSSYYRPGTVIDQPTMQMEVPSISVKGSMILTDIPANKTGAFQLQIINESESGDDATFNLKADDSSNPNGASFYLDGSPLGNGRTLLVRYGETLLKTLEVGKGANGMDFNNLRLILESQCQAEISDTISVSVGFVPACSDLSLEFPLDKWVINTNTGESEDTQIMPISVNQYDINQSNLNSIVVEYKPSSAPESAWTTIQSYFIDSTAYKASPLQSSFKQILPGGSIKYDFRTYKLDNQYYDVRAKSVCKISNSDIISYSDVASGIKDAVRPRLFGSALPANGILTINDEVRLNFSEDIADGLLSKADFQVTGIINGSSGDHSASLYFDGLNDYVYTEAEKNMTGKSLTFEAWVKRDRIGKAILFSQGNINNDIEFGFNDNDQLEVRVGAKVVSSTERFADIVNWQHVAFVFDARKEVVTIYQNFKTKVDETPVTAYTGEGNIEFGRSMRSQDGYLNGRMHEVRVWNSVITAANIQINSLSMLSGGELGLTGYWPMTESKGTIAIDKAGGANATVKGNIWYIDPRGKALSLSGLNSSIKIETGSVVVKPDMEYTVELWFKGEAQANATLISNGRGDGRDYDFSGTIAGSRDLLWIGFNETGQLTLRNNGYENAVTGDFLDNNWHHLAFAVNRRGNAQILIDGELKTYFEASNLGGFAAANLYLGARSYMAAGNTRIQDMFFKGKIDEFRIWNLYLDETLINKNNNIRLKGDELGLMAYYPFDKYITFQGETFLQFTPNDIREGSVAMAPVLTGAAESDDTGPVKGRGPVKTLDFDFVVNKDALIINLLQDRADIEKTIVTFTVDNIQDMNGNKIASPVTWSAYINRNQLRWEDKELILNKDLNEKLTFTGTINNIGGSVQSFSIENLPVWLTSSVTAGTIEPNSSLTVQFTVNDALNIGSYDERIYLRNSDDVVEAMNVVLKVRGEAPAWTVDPADYKYNMSVYAKLRINNIFSSDKEDMIAAFNKGNCVGVANVQYEKRNDMWYAFLTVYSNQTTEEGLQFRIWDASTGKTYLADAGSVISFVNNKVIGTPSNPAIFDAREIVYQNIPLSAGWNWISFNVGSEALNDLNSVLSDMSWDRSNYFKSEADNISANYSQTESKWIAEKSLTLSNSLMYKISSTSKQTINISGAQVLPSSRPLTIKGGQWNYISYLPAVRLTIDEALAGYEASEGDIIKSQTAFAMYANKVGWVGSLLFLEQGKGYMLYRNGITTANLRYPDNNGSMSEQKGADVLLNQEYVNTSYSQNMNMVATTDFETMDNDKVLAFSGDELISSAFVKNIEGKLLYFLTVTGEKQKPLTFAIERDGNIIARTTEPLMFTPDAVKGTIEKPFELRFSFEGAEFNFYPNPVKEILNITVSSKEANSIIIRILDPVGREKWIDNFTSGYNGFYQKQVDFSKFQKGVYLVQINVDGKMILRKIVKM
jgi:hypothetical protein